MPRLKANRSKVVTFYLTLFRIVARNGILKLPSATRSLASRNFERVAQLEVEQVNQTERDKRKSVGSDDLLLSLSPGSLPMLHTL